jgi:antitoxin (DNA-binding transcriptional repressor) of toxin-antitoxin stability system
MATRRKKPEHKPAPSSSLAAPRVVEIKAGLFKDRCLQLMDEVRDGDIELIVTKHGKPVIRVTSPGAAMPSAFGFMRGTILSAGDVVAPDFEAWGDQV